MSQELMQKIACENAFTIPLFGGIPVPESVVVTWGVMAVLIVLSILLTRKLSIVPCSRVQVVLEIIVGGIYRFFEGILGKEGRRYFPYLATVMLYLGVANLTGLVGVKPPTKDMNVTAALALMSIVLIEYAGLHEKGLKGFLRSFSKPVAFILPLNVLEIFIRPLSLCMRLFGNMFGGFVVLELIKLAAPVLIPVPFSLYFDIFDGLLQMFVFVLLTSLFMKETME